jgi:hypothetical protein
MNARSALFGLLSLVPASLNAAPLAAGALIVPLCSSGGAPQMIALSGTQPGAPIPATGACCAKGCHGARKRGARLEPEQ